MKTDQKIFSTQEVHQYMSPYRVERVRVPESCLMAKGLLQGIEVKENVMTLAKAIEKVERRQALDYFAATLSTNNRMPFDQAKRLFQSVNRIATGMIPEGLLQEVRLMIRVSNAESRGFMYDEDKDQFTFNANTFAKHVSQRCHACTSEDGRLFLYNKKGVYEELPEVKLGKIFRHIMHEGLKNSWKSIRENEAVKAVQREVPTVQTMNAYRDYINLENGMLSLDTFDLQPHSPSYYSTVQSPIHYDPDARAPRFLAFMREIMTNDEELVHVIQEIIGYCLTAETKAEKAFYFFGRGANGKSVLAYILTQLVGKENVSSIPLANFNQDFGLESIINKSVNIATENELGGKSLKTENFKAIVSGDRININIKYQPHINYESICKPIFLVNNLPDTSDTTHGYFRKIMIIPFNRTFKEAEQNVHLKATLVEELPGILNWALEGLKRLRKHDFQFSQSLAIEHCQQAYYAEQNPVREFYRDHIVTEIGARTRQSHFYVKYMQWLSLQGIDDKGTKSRQVFWRQFKQVLESAEIPITKKKVKGIVYFDGLKIVGLEETPTIADGEIQF